MKQLIRRFIVLLFVLTPVLSKAQFGPQLKTYVYTAPEKTFPDIYRVAVLNFKNLGPYFYKDAGVDFGTRMVDFLTDNLLQEYRGGEPDKIYIQGAVTNIYKLIEREQLNTVMREQNLQSSDRIDDQTAVSIGKILGVDAIIMGSLSFDVKDERTTYQTKEKDGSKKTHYKLARQVTSEARMKIIKVETAEIIGSFTPKQALEDVAYSDKGYPSHSAVQTVNQMADDCFRFLASECANYCSPYYRYESFDIERVRVKEFKDRAKDAEDYMKKGEIDRAYKLYKAMYDEDSYNPELAYNLGILYEATGDFEQAYSLYGVAYQLDEDKNKYHKAYQQAESELALVSYLNEMGLDIKKYEFREGGASVLADKIKTKGNRNDRIPVRIKPVNGEQIVARVPGDLEFKIKNRLKDWYEIELLGGKSGFVHKSDVREE
ncbi:DUF6340 family protein [Sunxiuqinia indica]|uniref:DUF6340 family protein n=1 Tax=Sunxiuqinia indica TaxID=2692584 RepID=UPI001357107F|nr:DUF6340 family protein [Sunxiuqinia indica]